MGHHAEIFTFTLQYPNFLFPGKTQYASEPAPPDIRITQKLNSMNPVNWLLVGNQIKKQRPDILLFKFWLPFMGPSFGTIARRAKSNDHTKVISILDNVIPHEARAGDVAFTKYFLKSSDGFITMSNTVTNDLEKFVSNKPIAFQPHPLYDNFGEAIDKSDAKKQLKLDPSYDYILFFGFIRKYKGLDLLLKALADERLKSLPLKLIVAGEFYENSAPYLDIISKYRLQDRVIMKTDFIPDQEVHKYFSAADMVVQPYKHATQSGVTQIAYQFNKPMIVTRVGGLGELVPDGKAGLVVEPNEKAIADAVYRFYSMKLESELVTMVAEEKKKFSWQSMVQAILDVRKNIS